ncbi:MAG: hypothetical protein KF901_23915, partial [Myxococcales bacterium]|nr:hypothetical protein [Myxococcales bacterium]
LLRPLQDALDEASAHGAPGEAHLRAFTTGVALWRFTGGDLDVERVLVDHAIPVAWELYGHKRWELLRRLDGALAPAVDALAARVAEDPELVAYASRCAQMLVFRAELEPRLDAQIALAERALSLCDTHRNGRLVLSDLLSLRAQRALEAAPIWNRREAVLGARDDFRRARALWPELERLRALEAALRREGVEP